MKEELDVRYGIEVDAEGWVLIKVQHEKAEQVHQLDPAMAFHLAGQIHAAALLSRAGGRWPK